MFLRLVDHKVSLLLDRSVVAFMECTTKVDFDLKIAGLSKLTRCSFFDQLAAVGRVVFLTVNFFFFSLHNLYERFALLFLFSRVLKLLLHYEFEFRCFLMKTFCFLLGFYILSLEIKISDVFLRTAARSMMILL